MRADTIHAIRLREPILDPEDGLILGNGDLSVSVYQTRDRIVWRFGKGDVWDRRLDRGDDPKPAHIDEVSRGIREEGWKCGPYGGPVTATRGARDPRRMTEICQGTPPSYTERPYPCPKPVGELALYLPADQSGMSITQELAIEEATLRIGCEWESGVRARVICFVHPQLNVLCIRWDLGSWGSTTRTMHTLPGARFALYRWADPDARQFKARFFGDYRHSMAAVGSGAKVTPLSPPTIEQVQNCLAIAQDFPADPTFPEGFRCLLAPFSPGYQHERLDTGGTGEARLHILPPAECVSSWLVVGVATGGSPKAAEAALEPIAARLAAAGADGALDLWAAETRAAARAFWSRSGLFVSDTLLEDLWYQTLHIRRSTYRAGKVPPGLFLPSTVRDYSHWHGDYHSNYNFQQPFWGDCGANHPELADAFFTGMEYFLQMGRIIARNYYDCRGAFIQLTAFPILAEDDCLGIVPMGRMAYMTGWVTSHYWMRWRATLDQVWLSEVGYPAIRECALFYTDFLKRGADGLFHAFPSNQGEDGFTGDPRDYTDRPQVMRHARYCLRVAAAASEVLQVDEELRQQWLSIHESLAPEDGSRAQQAECYPSERDYLCPPEFLAMDGVGRDKALRTALAELRDPKLSIWTWYCGKLPWYWMIALRGGAFEPETDLPRMRELIRRWRHPNGLLWAMSVGNYGHAGAWTETLGIIAPLQEMFLQSWDGIIRLFPAASRTLTARITSWRAEGAFLVSASWDAGKIRDVQIVSEKGEVCRIADPWPEGFRAQGERGDETAVERETRGVSSFATQPGRSYVLLPASSGGG